MCNEILNNGGILALIGVFVGFLLSEVSGAYKKNKEQNESKAAVFDEVRFNYEQTKNKVDILNQAISALTSQKFLSTKCAKYSTTEFENMYRIAIPKLSIVERDNLRHLNSFYLTIDKILDGFDETFKNDIDNSGTRKNTIELVYVAAVIQLEGIRDSLSISLQLSSALLESKPLPIFGKENA